MSALSGHRMVVALRQMLASGETQEALAARIGVSQSAVTQWARDVMVPKQDKVERFAEAFKIPASSPFFTDPTLGESPDYRDFVGRENRVERDDAKGTPAVESFLAEIAAAGAPASEEAARHLRGMRHSSGDVSRDAVQAEYLSWRNRQAGRALPDRPNIAPPIDEARGQRKLEPPKKRGPR